MADNRIQSLRIGISEIQRWRTDDEQHLPPSTGRKQAYLPEVRALDQILRRETLDERLSNHLLPNDVDENLLQPRVLTETRIKLRQRFAHARDAAFGRKRTALDSALHLLEDEVEMDEEIRTALAALLRG